MNISELARILRVSPQELRDKLPQFGFDLGQKAIKIDNQTANKVIRNWSMYNRQFLADQISKSKVAAGDKDQLVTKEIKVPKFITVKNFAELAGLPINKVLAELIKNSVFTSLNEKIDFDTALIIGADLGIEVKLEEENDNQAADDVNASEKIKLALNNELEDSLEIRPPVIVVMGHVDHGKTKLLDAIRNTDVVATEAGGITQHIGAYQITRNNKLLTFIDTPGHEAFTAMRNRGARVADIAILVVAADDGVKPQTVEAYRIIEAAKIPFVVAINKIDKPDVNLDKVKQELSSQLNIIPEDWGGKIICVPVSAKNNTGVDELLDMLLLVSSTETGNLKASVSQQAIGTIVESRIDKGEGPVATVLVQNGILRVGDNICINQNFYGKARALKNYLGQSVNEAKPSTPVKIIGLKMVPVVGDILEVKADVEKAKFKKNKTVTETIKQLTEIEQAENDAAAKIILIIKSDTLGVGEAIEGSLSKIDTQGVKIKIISKGLGNITEGDVIRAEAAKAKIVGFNVKLPPQVSLLSRNKKVTVKLYKIIYELINDLKKEIQELVKPEIERVDLGQLKVLAIFRTEPKFQIIGGKITEGIIEKDCLAEIYRDNQLISTGKITKLQSNREEVVRAERGTECGLTVEGKPIIKVDDILTLYQEKKIYKKIV